MYARYFFIILASNAGVRFFTKSDFEIIWKYFCMKTQKPSNITLKLLKSNMS